MIEKLTDLHDFVAHLTAEIRGDRPAAPPDPFDEDKLPYGVRAGDNKFGFETCPTCGKPPTQVGRQGFPAMAFLFADRLSAQEYRISAMCQKCQDETFVEEED